MALDKMGNPRYLSDATLFGSGSDPIDCSTAGQDFCTWRARPPEELADKSTASHQDWLYRALD